MFTNTRTGKVGVLISEKTAWGTRHGAFLSAFGSLTGLASLAAFTLESLSFYFSKWSFHRLACIGRTNITLAFSLPGRSI
jgi:hypothetical protein